MGAWMDMGVTKMDCIVIVGTAANIEAEYGARGIDDNEFALAIMDGGEIIAIETFKTKDGARRAAKECTECKFEFLF
jgi:hypothetical protein